MKSKLFNAGAIVILAFQPAFAGTAAVVVSPLEAAPIGSVTTPAVTAEPSNLLLAQNQNQNQGGNQNRSQNENQNQNQNENRNQNENQNRNRNNDTPAALAAATAQAVAKPNHACFYEAASFKGAKFCAEPGHEATSVSPGWNDRISSIEIVGQATVRVCTDVGYAGICENYTASVDALPNNLDDAISSWKVE